MLQDGFCDEACNNEECLFDGRDCDDTVPQCHPGYDVFCSENFGNGRCDEKCNTAACGWDGLDCESASRSNEIIPGSFYVVLTMSVEDFDDEMQQRFSRYLSLVMRSNFKIRRDESGKAMVHPFDPAVIPPSANYAFNTNMLLQGNLGIVVYLEIDNVKCAEDAEEHCFDNAEGYANLFGAMMGADKLQDDWGIIQVGARLDEGKDEKGGSNATGIAIGVTLFVIIIVVLGVLTNGKKRRAKGVTWFPEGFRFAAGTAALRPAGHKRPHDSLGGQEMLGKYPSSALDNSQESWSDDGSSDQQQPSKRQRRCGEFSSGQTLMTNCDNENGSGDYRQWTQQHLDAAGTNPDVLGALTPPQGGEAAGMRGGDLLSNDVDVRGPMGMTPLMIASFRGGGLDTGDLENFENFDDDSSPIVIQDLINQVSKLISIAKSIHPAFYPSALVETEYVLY